MPQKVTGTCCLCGETGELSFEHCPPQKAFNNDPLLYADVEWIRSAGNIDVFEGHRQHKGAGGYTLCPRCNHTTGSWYGSSYVDLTRQGMNYLQSVRAASYFRLAFRIRPLRVIKQIVSMFLSVNGPTFHKAQPALARFVLNRDARHLPDYVRVFAFYTVSDRSRSHGLSGMIDGILTGSAKSYFFSETTFPPFGFVMTFGSPPPDDRLTDITYFADEYGYEEKRTLWLRFPVLPIYTYFPGDYRNREKVLGDAEQR